MSLRRYCRIFRDFAEGMHEGMHKCRIIIWSVIDVLDVIVACVGKDVQLSLWVY